MFQYSGNGVAFSLFGVEVRWYGIIIVFAMILAVVLGSREAKRRGMGEDIISDAALWFLPGGIIGARIWYVLFEWDKYQGDIAKIINIRQGGLAIQGGVIAALLIAYLFTKSKNIYFLRLTDVIFPFVALGQSIGRWGNFANNEAYGYATDLPWALHIEGVGNVHPTFLYESIGTFCIFIFLTWFTRKKLKTDGQVTMLYLILYGIVRIFVESFRTDSLYFMGMRTAQLTAAVGIVLGVIGLLLLKNKKPLAHIEGQNPYNK